MPRGVIDPSTPVGMKGFFVPEPLQIRGVSKTFGKKGSAMQALQPISLDIAPGEFLVIVGPSGCGKSTLLRLIGGLEQPTQGSIAIGSKQVDSVDPRCAIVFQEPRLFPWKKVTANIAVGARRLDRKPDPQVLVDRVGLSGFEQHYPNQLSGGMAQRVALARALIGGPQVILLDEPFAALDALTRLRMQDLVNDICGSVGSTVVMVTHDIDEALHLADRIVVMSPRPGTIVEEISIDTPRPRERGDAHLAALRARILRHFGFETCTESAAVVAATPADRQLLKSTIEQGDLSFMNRRRFTLMGASALGLGALGVVPRFQHAAAQDAPGKIVLDYAFYNPSSLVLKEFGWIEEDVAADGVEIEWVWSAGSNKANEYLRSDAVDLGSTAGSAALLARANGSGIQTVYLYSQPEWSALVAPPGSDITTVEGLAGKKVAATKGTDPYFFLLRSLNEVGLSGNDVEVVNVQHADGKTALENGDVDAWAGLDPYMAQTEIEHGSTLFHRNIDFNSWGFLNARTKFLDEHPAYVTRILVQYERARQWIRDNPDEASAILARDADLSKDVADKELFERTNLDIDPVPGPTQTAVLEEIIPIFEAEDQLQPGADVNQALAELFNTTFIEEAIAQSGAGS
ncbi:MAG: aliphatic sulfonate ABC transporter substrate-binding protein [Thermomicrobiales bacterium]|nr:aliphatic sulfonate ABC transporter substrate-binding protein [Thermomicrobiales bacterium]